MNALNAYPIESYTTITRQIASYPKADMWLATLAEIPDLRETAPTETEAMKRLRAAFATMVARHQATGTAIPNPAGMSGPFHTFANNAGGGVPQRTAHLLVSQEVNKSKPAGG